ncbi:hypothetical protein L9F63_016422, partial [Diploptera punctata]
YQALSRAFKPTGQPFKYPSYPFLFKSINFFFFFVYRADYWKSQTKKFCEFCKCWIADNKPSIEFHEKGKRHKENVGKRLSEISKKSQKEYQHNLKVDDEMKKMEEAALKAYMKDVEANPDFTSQMIKEKLAQKGEENDSVKVDIKTERVAEQETNTSVADVQVKIKPQKQWYEAQSEEGYTYYWHIETGESKWEPPEDGYTNQKSNRKDGSRMNHELRDFRRTELDYKVLQKYNRWQSFPKHDPEPIDLQLPHQEFIEIKVPVATEPRIRKMYKDEHINTILTGNHQQKITNASYRKKMSDKV